MALPTCKCHQKAHRCFAASFNEIGATQRGATAAAACLAKAPCRALACKMHTIPIPSYATRFRPPHLTLVSDLRNQKPGSHALCKAYMQTAEVHSQRMPRKEARPGLQLVPGSEGHGFAAGRVMANMRCGCGLAVKAVHRRMMLASRHISGAGCNSAAGCTCGLRRCCNQHIAQHAYECATMHRKESARLQRAVTQQTLVTQVQSTPVLCSTAASLSAITRARVRTKAVRIIELQLVVQVLHPHPDGSLR